MQFLHISDLHLGKRLHGFSLLEDQRFFLFERTLPLLRERKIGVLVIAGDIYDAPIPPQDAVLLLDEFLSQCASEGIEVLVISGNHDSSDRLSYGARFFAAKNIHIATSVKDSLNPLSIEGVNFYLMPFMKHHDVNGVFGTEFKDYASAASYLVEQMHLDPAKKNVLVAHQLVLPEGGESGLERSGSEEASVGAIPNIPSEVFKDFDYVALGHIHKPQKVGKNAYFCGCPIKYHVDEANNQKQFNIVTIDEAGCGLEVVPIVPLRDLKIVTGSFDEIIHMPKCLDFVAVTLTDTVPTENAMDKIRNACFPLCLSIEYKNLGGQEMNLDEAPDISTETPEELFGKFYEQILGTPLTDYQNETAMRLLARAKGEDHEAD
ncbi:MAG: exonuclease SbcCD subunit D [Bacilli bacterium]|nr:exonuclease SbcCD subunit D [Bacilli bacterium]